MRRVLVVHAHPDDEVFATAAATISLGDEGAHIELRIATGGEAGELATTPGRSEPDAWVARERRLTRSCRLLGISAWDYLTRPGEWVDARSATDARTVANADRAYLAAAIRQAVDQVQPELLLTVGSDGLTGHPDHLAVHDAARRALKMPGWQPSRAWGARLRRADVCAGRQLLGRHLGVQGVGSGRVRGADDGTVLHPVECTPEEADRRKEALDCYSPGLGTTPLDAFLAGYPGRGDSLLLRATFDATTWRRDYYEDLQ